MPTKFNHVRMLPTHPKEYLEFKKSPHALPDILFPRPDGRLSLITDTMKNPGCIDGADQDMRAALGGLTNVKVVANWRGYSAHRKTDPIDLTDRVFRRDSLSLRVSTLLFVLIQELINKGYMDAGFQGAADVIQPTKPSDMKKFFIIGLENTYYGHWIPIVGTLMETPAQMASGSAHRA